MKRYRFFKRDNAIVCEIKAPAGTARGISRCNKSDAFDLKRGRKIAGGRALEALEHEEADWFDDGTLKSDFYEALDSENGWEQVSIPLGGLDYREFFESAEKSLFVGFRDACNDAIVSEYAIKPDFTQEYPDIPTPLPTGQGRVSVCFTMPSSNSINWPGM